MCAFAADDAKLAVDLRLIILHCYSTHRTLLGAFGAADAGGFVYLHSKGSGDKASQNVKQGIICTHRAEEQAVAASAFREKTEEDIR